MRRANQFLILFLLLFSTGFAFGKKKEKPSCYPNNASAITKAGLLPSARECMRDPCGRLPWTGNFDFTFLYWQARQDGLEYTAKNSPNTGSLTPGIVDINTKNIFHGFEWKPAFKIDFALGAPNNWDVLGRWTYYHSHSTSSATASTASPSAGLLSLWTNPVAAGQGDRFANARSKWKLRFNTLDLEVGNAFRISDFLKMRFHGGAKGIFMHQDFRVRYSGGASTNPISIPIAGDTKVRMHVKGAGPRFGVDTRWETAYDIFILANASTSLLLQDYDIRRRESDSRNIVVAVPYTIENHQSIWIWKPETEFQFGLGWGRCVGGKVYAGFQVAYEVQYFYEENLFFKMPDSVVTARTISEKGDMILHGLNIELNVQF